MYRHGQHTTDEEEHDGCQETVGVEVGEEVEHNLVLTQVHVDAGLSECSQSQEHKGDTKEEVADIAFLLRID